MQQGPSRAGRAVAVKRTVVLLEQEGRRLKKVRGRAMNRERERDE